MVPNIGTIAVPNFDIDLLGHSYFAEAETLLYDMRGLMHNSEEPPLRPHINTLSPPAPGLWPLGR